MTALIVELTATTVRCGNVRLEAGRAPCHIADSVLPTHGSTVCHFHFKTCEDGGISISNI